VIDVNIIHRRGVFRVLFLELIRFGLLAHAATASASTTRGL
jgi:hypothetical protein